MRFDLEVAMNDGVLSGSLDWAGRASPQNFHGTLELIALLEAATTSAEGQAAPDSVAATPAPGHGLRGAPGEA